MPSREEMLLGPIHRGMRIIEIGPSFRPVASKAQGWNVRSIDHLSREALAEKYREAPGVDISQIEEVDFVWTAGELASVVPRELHGSFDALIASHVIEHSPDLVAFLDSVATLVNRTGVVALAVPDKRFCFDYFNPLTMTSDLLTAWLQKRTRHTRGTAFSNVAYAASESGGIAWGEGPIRDLKLVHSLADARAAFEATSESEDAPYQDMHAWRFTPASFELLMLELAWIGATDWKVEHTVRAEGCEFFAWLRRGGTEAARALSSEALEKRRFGLLKKTLYEIGQQTKFMLVENGEDFKDTLEPSLHKVATLDGGLSTSVPHWAARTIALAEEAAADRRLQQAQVEQIARRVEQVEAHLSALLCSISWRLTEPLRGLVNSWRGLNRRIRRGWEQE